MHKELYQRSIKCKSFVFFHPKIKVQEGKIIQTNKIRDQPISRRERKNSQGYMQEETHDKKNSTIINRFADNQMHTQMSTAEFIKKKFWHYTEKINKKVARVSEKSCEFCTSS